MGYVAGFRRRMWKGKNVVTTISVYMIFPYVYVHMHRHTYIRVYGQWENGGKNGSGTKSHNLLS